MSLSYREYEIFYDDPGVTIHRSKQGYGAPVVYKKRFPSLEEGLMYIAERISVTDGGDVKALLSAFKSLRADLKTIAGKILPKSPEEVREAVLAVKGENIAKNNTKKIIKKIIKKSENI